MSLKSMTGYELKHLLDVSAENIWHAKQSQIYTTLKKLESDGLLISHVEPQSDRPDRRVYTLTEEGQKDLKEWLSKPITTIQPSKDPFLLKFFFGLMMDKEELLTQLRIVRELRKQQLKHYTTENMKQLKEELNFTPPPELLPQAAVLWERLRIFGEVIVNTYVEWLEETIAIVEEKI